MQAYLMIDLTQISGLYSIPDSAVTQCIKFIRHLGNYAFISGINCLTLLMAMAMLVAVRSN